ncbi:TonB-dependent SusC/RagA subfamily outer membrane receptor [Chryseobacterium ginsenosidimutans]|uniref:TonB-dependent receptor plug domain-containing protein n=1 Tax=Chryseobacterium ginsenosidimutans TaxID=687846 RepID=UPI00216751B5|nr:TonB-dependent receptor plug domain-containing protein [Chryseobacterium ginsenosidimutans]MCS3869061.1 TonB-dependent SusC/RagA subfamily outer membrane receptor [Chryseobacterium ginsenosidimutans]
MKITIPKPCHENWGTMTPEEKGRFCSVCAKTVRDFTIASDEEIIDVFSNTSENICGNFNQSQLNRDLRYSYINSLFSKFAVGFMLTTGGIVSVNAQQNITNDTLKAEEVKEVVIMGFSKRTTQTMMVGSTTVVSEKELIKAQENKIQEIQGKFPGLNINQIPKDGSGSRQMTIGGANSSASTHSNPLIVVNKKIMSLKELQELDPKSIKTMNLLKGTSATAIYGEDGKNGVILVTTKKGKKVKKLR